MKNIAFRKYSVSDESAVNEMTERLYYEVFQKFSKDTVQMIFKEETAVGWIHLSLPESSLYSGFVFLYIDPKHRRKGIGTYAYRQAENRLKAIGCNVWSSYPESKAADTFAMSVGFDYTNTNSCPVMTAIRLPRRRRGFACAGLKIIRPFLSLEQGNMPLCIFAEDFLMNRKNCPRMNEKRNTKNS